VELETGKFFEVHPVRDVKRMGEVRAAYQMGLGETSTLVMAKETGAALVILDDKQARAAAQSEGLKVAGTLRILELAYERGLIKDLRSVYDKLNRMLARIKGDLLEASLKRYGLPLMR
jgi:hypothetical protein